VETSQNKKLEWLVGAVCAAWLVMALVIPLSQSYKQYQKYQKLTKQDQYVNATMRVVDNRPVFSRHLVRGCFIKVEYEYLVAGNLI
jgi:hypothetical protein